eukprot:m.265986 g.265986  ORF g.265986 m.265986 type:complete len:449 (+) comp64759_c0_seq1:417-1763(+)
MMFQLYFELFVLGTIACLPVATSSEHVVEAHHRTIGPNMIKPDDLLFFHHIMKTGGTSVSASLQHMFLVSETLPGSHPSGRYGIADLTAKLSARGIQSIPSPIDLHQAFRQYKVGFSHSSWSKCNDIIKRELKLPFDVSQVFKLAAYSSSPNPSDITSAPDDDANSPRVVHILDWLRDPTELLISTWGEWMCFSKLAVRMCEQSFSYTKFNNNSNKLNSGHGLTKLECGSPDSMCPINLTRFQIGRAMRKVSETFHATSEQRDSKLQLLTNRNLHETKCADPVALVRAFAEMDHVERHEKFGACPPVADDVAVCNSSVTFNREQCQDHLVGFIRANRFLVGVLDRMHDSMCLLHYYTGKPYVTVQHTRNSNDHPPASQCLSLTPLFGEKAADLARTLYKQDVCGALVDAARIVLDERIELARQEILSRPDPESWKFDKAIGTNCFNLG